MRFRYSTIVDVGTHLVNIPPTANREPKVFYRLIEPVRHYKDTIEYVAVYYDRYGGIHCTMREHPDKFGFANSLKAMLDKYPNMMVDITDAHGSIL